MTIALAIAIILLCSLGACVIKGAARVYRRVKISWSYSLICVIVLLYVSKLFGLGAAGGEAGFSLWVSYVIDILFNFLILAFLFSIRAKTSDGQPLGVIGSFKFSGIVIVLFVVIVGTFSLIISGIEPRVRR